MERKNLHLILIDCENYSSEIKWVINVFSNYAGVDFDFEGSENTTGISIGYSNSCQIQLSEDFYTKIYSGNYNTEAILDNNMHVVNADGNIDVLSTAFYFLNCLWELDPESPKDKWGRSEFEHSVWKRYNYNKPVNHVNKVFDLLAEQLKINVRREPTKVFLSHDIDVVYGAWLENGKSAIRKGRYIEFINGIIRHLKGKPDWFNFKKISDLELQYNVRSTFFWIPIKGKENRIGKNADYSINHPRIKNEIIRLSNEGFSNGLHKSLSRLSIKEESELLPFEAKMNRYHYLKFNWPELINETEYSNIRIDSSLAYAQIYGYRNGYSLPFIPFNLELRKSCNFLEVPLCIMDGTFSKYLGLPASEAQKLILEFFNEYNNNSVITILWHNSHFTDLKYEGYPELYKNLLEYIKVNNLVDLGQKELCTIFESYEK